MKRLPLTLALAATLTLSACAAPAPSTVPAGAPAPVTAASTITSISTFVKGKAHVNAPLVGARVQFFDASGAMWKESPEPTSASGTFAFNAFELVGKNLRVRVTGGTVNGEPFTGTLECAVDGFDPAEDLIYCNPTTSVASALLRLKGGSAAAAAEQVRRYLALPSSMNLGPSVDNPYQEFFSEALFLKEAGGLAGFDVMVQRLAAEAAAAGEGTKTRRFRDPARAVLQAISPGSLASALWQAGGKAAAISVGKTLLTSVGGALFSYALSAAGLDPATNQRKEILDQIKQVSAKIDQLSADVHRLQDSVDSLHDDVRALSGKVDQLQNSVDALAFRTARDTALLAYDNAIAGDFRRAKALIDTRWDTYNWKLDHAAELTRDELAKVVADTKVDEIQDALTQIHQSFVGDLGTTPLMTLWGRVVAFQETALGGYPYIASDRYLANVRLLPDQLVQLEYRGTLLVSEIVALSAALDAPAGSPVPTTLPLDSEHAWDSFGDRVVKQRDKVWTANLRLEDIDKVAFSPNNGIVWKRDPLRVQYSRTGNPSFTTDGYGVFDQGNLYPTPSSLGPDSDVDVGRAWRWPTAAEVRVLGRHDANTHWSKLKDAGFRFNVPVNEIGHFWTTWQYQYGPDQVAGSVVMYTSTRYGDGTPAGIDLSNYVNTVAPNDPDYGWYYMGRNPNDPWRSAAVVYVPVSDLQVDPVAAEFAKYW